LPRNPLSPRIRLRSPPSEARLFPFPDPAMPSGHGRSATRSRIPHRDLGQPPDIVPQPAARFGRLAPRSADPPFDRSGRRSSRPAPGRTKRRLHETGYPPPQTQAQGLPDTSFTLCAQRIRKSSRI